MLTAFWDLPFPIYAGILTSIVCLSLLIANIRTQGRSYTGVLITGWALIGLLLLFLGAMANRAAWWLQVLLLISLVVLTIREERINKNNEPVGWHW